MKFDLETCSTALRYKLLSSSIVPRPIAWVISKSGSGALNLAPFSNFNLMGSNPPVVAIGFTANPDESLKHTPTNILETREFVVHLVNEAMVEAMNLSATDAPREVSEAEALGLALLPSDRVDCPRLAEAPVALECVRQTALLTGPTQLMIVAEAKVIHFQDGGIKDVDRGYVHTEALDLVARMHGTGFYTRTRDLFHLERKSYKEVQENGPPFLRERTSKSNSS